MDGPTLHRRSSDWPTGTRLTVLEVEMLDLKGIVKDHKMLIEKLDKRADRQDIIFARLLAGLAVLVFLGQLLAPILLKYLGVEH